MKWAATVLILAFASTLPSASTAQPLAGSWTCESAAAVSTGGSAGVLLAGEEQWWVRSSSGRLGVSGAGIAISYFSACGEPDGNCSNANEVTIGIGCSQAPIVRVVSNGLSATSYAVTVT